MSAASTRDPQAPVTTYFQQDAPFWSSLYEDDTVFAVIHQLRAAMAVRWIERLDLGEGAPVLEVGCGAGLTAVELARRGLHVTATDSTPAMIELTGARAAEAGLQRRIDAEIADVHRLTHPDASFDLVLALGVLPWLHTPEQGLAEMSRVLRGGGHLLVSADNRSRLINLVDPMRSPLLAAARGGMRRLARRAPRHGVGAGAVTARQLERALGDAGLRTVEAATLGFGPFTLLGRRVLSEQAGLRLHRGLQRRADGRAPLLRSTGSQHLVLARRDRS